MFESRLVRTLKEGERLVWIVRRYWLTLLFPILVSSVISIAPFFFLVPLFRLGTKGMAGFFVLLGTGVILLIRTMVVYSYNAFIITDQRIIDVDQRGFFNRTVSDCLFANIQDVSVQVKGLGATVLHYGTIIIQTAGSTANVELHGVKDPERVQEALSRLIEESRQQPGETLSAAELLQLAQKMKAGLTPDAFRRMMKESNRSERE